MIILHEVGVLSLKKVLIALFVLLPASLWLSCGGSSSSSNTQTSGLKDRAFISNNVSAGTSAAGVYIVDAATDVRAATAPMPAGNNPGMMVLTPNRTETLVFSGNGTQFSDNQLTILNNATESAASRVALPGGTESFVVSPDSSSAYVAVPTAPVSGAPPGIVEAIALNSGTVTGQAEVPNVRFLAMDNGGDRVFGFSDNSDSIAIITPSNIGQPNQVVTTYVSGFDRPIAAFFSSDDTTAYIVNCGPECGGVQAGVQVFNMITSALGSYVPVPAATVALVNNSTMYLAGNPVANPNPQPCTGETTAATTCGLLTVVDLPTMTVSKTGIVITDGFHDRLALAAAGQLFIGARDCTEIVPPVPPPTGAEVRGCLSIYNTQSGTVVIPPENGDVTGIQPIPKRTAVYVIQNGSLNIYDAVTAALQYTQITNLVGQLYDVKAVDF